MSPREIAERIINQNEFKQEEFMWLVHNSEVLARAYLDLEKEKARLILHIDDIEKANDNCQTKIANLELEISKLKKSREVLRTACEFYGDRETWELSGSLTNKRYFKNLKSYGEALNDISEFQVPNTFGYAHENKELTYYIAGKKAREALEADDNLMKEV